MISADGAKELLGADIAALIGGTILNQLALAVGQQAVLAPERRQHVAVLVDEFHACPLAYRSGAMPIGTPAPTRSRRAATSPSMSGASVDNAVPCCASGTPCPGP